GVDDRLRLDRLACRGAQHVGQTTNGDQPAVHALVREATGRLRPRARTRLLERAGRADKAAARLVHARRDQPRRVLRAKRSTPVSLRPRVTAEPPGTILQRLYMRERLKRVVPGRFVEVGVGTGRLSRELIRLGWSGEGWDLSAEAVARTTQTNRDAIAAGRYDVRHGDWLAEADGNADLVVSSMVIEHLSETEEARYFERCRQVLAPGGRAVLFVPASPRHWGIEDEIAGHRRRYTHASLRDRLEELDFR